MFGDAMTSDRPYRDAIPKEEALQYIAEQAGIHFDPAIVAVFYKFKTISHQIKLEKISKQIKLCRCPPTLQSVQKIDHRFVQHL